MSTWTEQAKTRKFQLWEFHASHGTLLLRSPKIGQETNLDLLCFDVLYLDLPRSVDGLEFVEPTPTERAKVASAIGTRSDPWSLRIVASGGNRYAIAAGQFVEQENEKEAMASFLATKMRDPAHAPDTSRRSRRSGASSTYGRPR